MYPTEREIRDELLDFLTDYFLIRTEVSGTHCSGKKCRIDALLKPRDYSGWKDGENSLIGIEFKAHTGSSIKQMSQAVDYSHTSWNLRDRTQRCLVFCYPSWDDSHDGNACENIFFIDRLMGRFGVGKIRYPDSSGLIDFRLSGETFWHLYRKGQESGMFRNVSTVPRIGSR